MNNKDEELKKEKIKPILETLEELMEEDWDEAEKFLHNLEEIYWKDNFYSLAIIDKLSYYFGEIGVEADNDGTIYDCRKRGFELLEKQPDFLKNTIVDGSYGEEWSLRKVLRRFIWHDRIHAKAMYRMAVRTFGQDAVQDVFGFER